MNNFFSALYKLYPQTVRTVGDDAFDVDGNPVIYDAAAVQAELDRTAYIDKRVAEYPALGDFADAYYWSQNGDNTKMAAYLEKCDAVKVKYPKPS
jgi:hypothetical protein